jgi:molybdate/tungstate transport system substrate-binding protein
VIEGSISRRDYLTTVGTAIASGMAGCFNMSSEVVRVLAAGSLAHTFDDHIGPAFENHTDISVHGEFYGSTAIMRMVEDRTQHPDVIVSADAALLRERLYDEFTDWDIEFATNSLGIGYNKETAFGQALDRGEPWYEVVRELNEDDLAIGDPDLDPLGYRAVQAFELAKREHDIDGFRERMMDLVYMEPEEPQMLAGVETGNRAGAIVYQNMAVDHVLRCLRFLESRTGRPLRDGYLHDRRRVHRTGTSSAVQRHGERQC